MSRSRWLPLLIATLLAAACGDSSAPPPDQDIGSDTGTLDAGADAEDTAPDADADDSDGGDVDVADSTEDPDTSDSDVADADTHAPWPETPRFSRYVLPPPPLSLPEGVEPCAVVGETQCGEDASRVCAPWDVAAEDWAEDPPRMADQAFWYDRYYDLYHEIEGMTVDILFTEPIPPGTPEVEWSQAQYFRQMDAYGDASGWSGTAVFGAAARYQATGSPADYERMVGKLEGMMFLYEVTGIPGMIARSHFGLLPEGAPRPVGHWGEALAPWFSDDGTTWHFHYPIGEELLDRLPEYYDGEVTISEETYTTTPRWMGDASRDMYVRSLPGILLALDLLGEGEREDRLRSVAAESIPCTLNRMKHGRIVNLQSRPDLLEAVTAFLGAGNLEVEEGDVDFSSLDTLVFFAMEQPHSAHMDLFDPSCPDLPPLEPDPDWILDASDTTFVLEMLQMFGRVGRTSNRPIAWIQAPSIRAADLMFMLQWALTAHYLTDEEPYLEFVDMLTRDTDFAGVLRTYGAFRLPKWCQSHYAPSLSYPTLYNLLARIDRDEFPQTWGLLSEVATTEGRDKEMAKRGDAYWGVLYNRMHSAPWDEHGAAYVAEHVELLRDYGFNPELPRDPDRNHSINWLDPPVEGLDIEEPSEADFEICEAPIKLLGLELPAPGMSDESPRAVEPLPVSMRFGSGFMWTGDPWRVVRETGNPHTMQYPMLGLTVPYWVGRSDGVISDGANLVLAWKDSEAACPTF